MLSAYLWGVLNSYGAFLITFSLCLCAEIFWRRGEMSVPDRARGLAIWAVYLPVSVALGMSLTFAREAAGFEPLVEFKSGFGSSIVAPLVGGLWGSFFFYWFHRAQHRFLWRFHSVHHSIRNLSGINSYHHWSEPFFYALVAGMPMALFDLETVGGSIWVITLMKAWPYFIHSPTTIDVGALRYVLIGPRYHRIHHSLEERHWDKNFGGFTPLWDWLFGTIYMPAKDEWPEVGLAYQDEPTSLAEWSAAPFKRRRTRRRLANAADRKPGLVGLQVD